MRMAPPSPFLKRESESPLSHPVWTTGSWRWVLPWRRWWGAPSPPSKSSLPALCQDHWVLKSTAPQSPNALARSIIPLAALVTSSSSMVLIKFWICQGGEVAPPHLCHQPKHPRPRTSGPDRMGQGTCWTSSYEWGGRSNPDMKYWTVTKTPYYQYHVAVKMKACHQYNPILSNVPPICYRKSLVWQWIKSLNVWKKKIL